LFQRQKIGFAQRFFGYKGQLLRKKSLFLDYYTRKILDSMANLSVGDMAPWFEGKTQDGTTLTLDDLKGRDTVLYFYPKDNTSGCTLEAKSLRDGQEALAERGYRIVGVSPDSERSHQNFCSKHDLRFTLLADTERTICEAFGVWVEKSMYGRKYMGVARKTFLLDEECRITHIFDKVKTAEHYQQIINELDKK
jgi:peroxiredoxin Q/BCP